MSRYAKFEPETIRFLEELSANNNRPWFSENKSRYEEQVLDVALRFIQSMHDPLHEIAPHFVAQATRVGGSLMRVYRDTRFSKNKLPYKTNVGIQFRHEQAKDVHSPGYYVHVAPDEVFLGAGMWRPDSDSLRKIRERIVAKPAEWRRVIQDESFSRRFDIGGEVLKRPPRGFDKDHEFIDDIKRKSFIAVCNLDSNAPLGSGFQKTVESSFRAAEPLMRFLCKSVGVPF
ncbi:MAG: TIGR02453 family protein [Woeseiaceae bacterium]|nr:TIGR02453 family protein [Woeseiaceae bacterium]NIP21068.1 TIGR02453 family protein [Woeseiaceae bacterium]NIS90040.1 TIGR02453 family protein [Woeseiaceae bacterium]